MGTCRIEDKCPSKECQDCRATRIGEYKTIIAKMREKGLTDDLCEQLADKRQELEWIGFSPNDVTAFNFTRIK